MPACLILLFFLSVFFHCLSSDPSCLSFLSWGLSSGLLCLYLFSSDLSSCPSCLSFLHTGISSCLSLLSTGLSSGPSGCLCYLQTCRPVFPVSLSCLKPFPPALLIYISCQQAVVLSFLSVFLDHRPAFLSYLQALFLSFLSRLHACRPVFLVFSPAVRFFLVNSRPFLPVCISGLQLTCLHCFFASRVSVPVVLFVPAAFHISW